MGEADILRLAAGVESNTNHPIGKAITEAARLAHCNSAKVIANLLEDYLLLVAMHFIRS